MIQVEADKSNNLLKISFSQHVGPEEAIRGVERVEALVADLPPGFRLLTDLSALESMDFTCAPHIKRVMELCVRRNVKSVVRVIPDPHKDIGLNIMSLFHYRRQTPILTFETLEEAMRALAD